ncbi:helicase [Streptomyces sp. AJS327]|uniref:HelD family protein n=1 Tax=Streptomyces sp. AJS327 TaxID=2545265 RepID=UPI0015DEE40C|nr:ATP-binding domain-containing protein [Streptomyces sp. AJS327]MBA0051034.1 helicase [Streptomyces sp. AJS327]
METRQVSAALTAALRAEQRYVDGLYLRLDEERAAAEAELAHVRRHGADAGTPQALAERDAATTERARRLLTLNSVDSGLCFGRIDTTDGECHYVGRIGLRDAAHEPLLVDWRAPAARPFYAATPGAPSGLARRRHLHSAGRQLTGVDDEVFAPDGLDEEDRRGLVGEAALLASLRRGRTGRMTDVVATIQTEQDRVIRSGPHGALVVQGGPGTGKTVAALHRAAYLLYTHRETLARRGVLIIGPNPVFLRYVGEVLPGLGESDVVLRPLGGLFPGLRAEAEDPPATAVVKGDPRMVEVLARAVRQRQRTPPGDLLVTVEGARHGEELTLRLPHAACVRAREAARDLGLPHNAARGHFLRRMLDALVRVQAAALDLPLDAAELRYGPGELWRQPTVRRTLGTLWPSLDPCETVAALLQEAGTLRAAAESLLDARERAALLRSPDAPWTVGDVPLLDEAAELLGEDGALARAHARAAAEERREEERYAREALRGAGLEGTLDAEVLADRYLGTGPERDTAERAAADRSWVYGHVIVDEAQELSPMAWRMVMRRVPSRSMTIVGDLAQTSGAAGADSWAEVLRPYLGDRWRTERLTVNYRTPSEVMEPAAAVLAEVAPELEAPESVRTSGVTPRRVRVPGGGLVAGAARAAADDLAALEESGGGRAAVIAPERLLAAVADALPGAALGGGAAVLEAPLSVLTVRQSKGLEFDRVVVVDPAGIQGASPRGGRDLYVALTRVTHRLTVVYEGEPPRALRPPAAGRRGPGRGRTPHSRP